MIEVSEQAFDKLLADINDDKQQRAEKMPDEEAALRQMFEAYIRLKEMGFRDIQYCPKDGTAFHVVEVGSTGIHEASYKGEYPDGALWVFDGDMWPTNPCLFREIKET